MSRFGKTVALVLILAGVPAAALAASASSTLRGSWHKLPAAPVTMDQTPTSVWTGKQLVVFGRRLVGESPTNVAASYDPAADTWRRLSPPSGPPDFLNGAVWTGKEVLLWGPFNGVAFDPATDQWRSLRRSLPGGIIVWTGREAIGWGGGCCGDARSDGAAYKPAGNSFRKLARSPLAPSQGPVGAWDGREVLLFVSGYNPDGKPYSARFARAAAYNPAKNSWRRLAPMPQAGGNAVWNGHELLVVGGGRHARSALAYNPATNRWRRLASLPTARAGAAAVWAGKQLLLWGGQTSNALVARGGLAYDPRTNRWSALPPFPLRARGGASVAWTGRALIVWGGEIGTPAGTSIPPKYLSDGAAFTPSTP